MDMSEKVQQVVTRSFRAWHSPESLKEAQKLIQDPTTPALILMIAARKRLGPTFVAYEPETLWLELDPPPMNRDKLMAGSALAQYPAFWWDWRVFGQTCLALNDLAVFPEQLPKPTMEQMAWGNFEAELILALSEEGPIAPVFDESVLAFMAVCAHDQGVVALCDSLKGAQPYLDKLLTPEAKKLASQVKKRWQPHTDRTNLEAVNVEDDAVGVQLAHLTRTQLYFVKRADALLSYL